MSDEGSTGGDIFNMAAAGGAAENLTPGRKSSPSWLKWLPNGRILFTETVDSSVALATLNPAANEIETLWRGDESLKAGDDTVAVSKDGKTLASVRSSWTMAPEVWAGPVGDWSKR